MSDTPAVARLSGRKLRLAVVASPMSSIGAAMLTALPRPQADKIGSKSAATKISAIIFGRNT